MRKKRSEEIRASRAEKAGDVISAGLEELMEYVSEGVAIASGPDVSITIVNLHGAESAEIPGGTRRNGPDGSRPQRRTIYHLDGVTAANAAELPIARALRRGETVANEEWLVREPSGQMALHLCSASPICSGAGRIVGGVAVWRDIGQRKRVENALQARAEFWRNLIDRIEEGMGIVDEEERFTFANPAAEEIFGVLPGNLVGRNLMDFLEPDQRAVVLEHTARRREGAKSTYELGIKRPAGEVRTLLVSATPRFDETGRYTGAWGIFLDITGHKHLQAVLQRAHQELRHRIRRKNLTSRQLEVLRLVAEGRSRKEIANALHISLKTVEFHKAHLMERLNVSTTAELTKYAIQAGLVPLD